MNYVTFLETPIGRLTLCSDGEALTAVDFPLWRGKPRTVPDGTQQDDLPVFREAKRWLTEYFDGREPNFMPAIRTHGTPFQETVWRHLRAIPYGQLTTYGAIAKAMEAESGKRQSAQAVGGAVGHNPICILIPCHRVVGSGGSLTGFGGGMDAKIALLQTESVDMEKLYRPLKGTAL